MLSFPYRFSLRPLLTLLVSVLLSLPALSVTLTLTPAIVASNNSTPVVLDIGGVTPGQTVIVERYLDVNGTGVLVAGDPLAERFAVTDGIQPTIAGKRVPMIPGDDDGVANGDIHVTLPSGNTHLLMQLAITSFFHVTDTAGNLLASANLTVTPYVYGQSISGQVTSSNGPLNGTLVMLLAAPDGHQVVAGALTNSKGNYSLTCPPGTYYLTAFNGGGYLTPTNWQQTPITITTGQALSQTLTLPIATAQISGTLTDRATGAPIPGVLVSAAPEHSDQPFAALGSTDETGTFHIWATADDWKVGPINWLSTTLGQNGYVNYAAGVPVSTKSGNQTGVTLLAAKATTVIAGTATAGGTPLAAVDVLAETATYDTLTTTDANGNYLLPVIPGQWHVKVRDGDLSSNSTVSQLMPDVVATNYQPAALNVKAWGVTTQFSGHVLTTLNAAVPGILVSYWGQDSTGRRCGGTTRTLADGSFTLGLTAGNWHVSVDAEDAANRGLFGAVDMPLTVITGVNQSGLVYTLHAATTTLSGSAVSGGTAVGGLRLLASDQNGTTFSVRTLPNGSFSIPAVAGAWMVTADAREAAVRRFYGTPLPITVQDGANQTGLSLALTPATTDLLGTVVTDDNNPASFLTLLANESTSGQTASFSTAANGNFDIPVFAGSWLLQVDPHEAAGLELFDSPLTFTVVNGVQQTGIQDMLQRSTAHLSGTVHDNAGNPGEGAFVTTDAGINGQFYMRSTHADSSGNYALGVMNGTWTTGAYMLGNATGATAGTRINFPSFTTLLPGAGTTINFIPNPGYLPDVMIRNLGDTAFIDTYTSGTGVTPTVTQDAGTGVTAVYQIQVQNLASANDRFLLSGPKGGNGWTVKYFDAASGGNDVTMQMTELGWSTEYLAPNALHALRIEVTPDNTVALKASLNVLLTAVSTTNMTPTAETVQATTIRSNNIPPVANNSVMTVLMNAPAASGTLSATDAAENPLTYRIITNGAQGTATVTNAGTGAFTYKPNAGAIGIDSFTFKANDGSIDSNAATVTVYINSPNFEADVTPRPNGKGSVTMTDWVQIGRFVTGLDTPASPAEFQRADCAPRNIGGDGELTIADWVQAGRYAAGLDPLTPAWGPTQLATGTVTTTGAMQTATNSLLSRAAAAVVKPHQLALSCPSLAPGQSVTMTLLLTAQGNENALGFTLGFDTTRLHYLGARVTGSAAKALLNLNANKSGKGLLGVALALPSGSHFTAGQQQVLQITFQAQPAAVIGNTPLTFSDAIVKRELSDATANILPSAFQNSTVQISGKRR